MAISILFTAAPARADVCPLPTADAGGPYAVASGGSIQLAGTATGIVPLTFLWTVSSGSLSDPAAIDPVFTAVKTGVAVAVAVTFTATNACGSATASTTITVDPTFPPVVNPVPPISAQSGAHVVVPLSATDPNVPPQPLTFMVTQSGTPALLNLTVTSTGPSTAMLEFDAPVLACDSPPVVVTLTIIVINPDGTESIIVTTVTIFPPPDAVTITSAEYRIKKFRLDVAATSSCISPNIALMLQPYATVNGFIFDPTPLGSFTNAGNGIYTLLVVGVPQPAGAIQAKSTANGISAPFFPRVKP
ncbi:MAG TPA: hypothetical protein VI356_02440 [Myxococcales bacterium]